MSTQYKLTNGTSILTGENYETTIPADENNEDYKTYLGWLAAGNTPEAADVIVAPHTVEPLEFLNLFTSDELTAIRSSSDNQVQIFLLRILAAKEYIDLNDKSVINGLVYLVGLGLLTEARKSEILS